MALPDQELATALSSGEIGNIQLGDTGTEDRVLKKSEVDASIKTTDDKVEQNILDIAENTSGISDNTAAIDTLVDPDHIDFTPQTTAPVEQEGRTFYDDKRKSLSYNTDIPGVTINTSSEQVVRAINRSGATITNGKAVRYFGIDGATNLPMIELGQADTFDNAHISGVLTHEAADNDECWITILGLVGDVDVAQVMETGQTMVAGQKLYLSATEAGKYTHDAPDIVVTCGGFFSGIQGVEPGDFFCRTYGIANFPTLTGFLQGQNVPTYTSTAVPQDITNYVVEGNIVLEVDPLTGIIKTYGTGVYDFNVTASMSFAGSSSTRSIYLSLYDVTAGTEKFRYTIAVPRDAIEVGGSFSFPGDTAGPTEYIIQISSSVDIDITFEGISFGLTSKNIR